MLKKILIYTFSALIILAGLGLLYLANTGALSFDPTYTRTKSTALDTIRGPVAFVDVNVVPMDSERVLPNQTVLIRDGQIEAIGPSAEVSVPRDAHMIRASEKFLIPGLVDMHVHVMNEDELLLFAAHGVTTVRNMWGAMNFTDHLGWRAEIEAGRLLGPTLYTTGPVMEGPPKTIPTMDVYTDPETAVAAVSQQIAQGYDFIKVYDQLDLPTYIAILTTAQAHGVMVVGHTPKKVGLERVLAGGQVTIEHLSGFIDNDAGEYAIPEAELPKYAEMAAAAGVYICPTIAVYQMYVPDSDLHQLEERSEMALLSPGMKALWRFFSRPGAMGNITYAGDYPTRIRELFLNTTRLLHAHGVKFVLGTDSDNPYLVPGISLLDELDYLVAAGFTPFEALETGTRNTAVALGKASEFGTIAVGKRADLLLLETNPLDNVANVRNQEGVMLRGRWLPKAELQSMLGELKASYRPSILERIAPLVLIGVGVELMMLRKKRGH